MAFDLGLVEDAYTAALSNPQHDTAEDKVRRLVLALVEQGERGLGKPGLHLQSWHFSCLSTL